MLKLKLKLLREECLSKQKLLLKGVFFLLFHNFTLCFVVDIEIAFHLQCTFYLNHD